MYFSEHGHATMKIMKGMVCVHAGGGLFEDAHGMVVAVSVRATM